MNKQKKGRKFNRTSDRRKAMIRIMCAEVLMHEKIKTTEAKAKELRMFVEPFITRAKEGTLASRRYLLRFLPKDIVKKLVEEIAPEYKNRPGGYTRVIKLGPRSSDGARMAIIELVK